MSWRPLRVHCVKKLAYSMMVCGSLLAGQSALALEFGIDRSNLTTQSEAVQQKTLQDIRSLHATWFRDALNHSTPQTISRSVAEVKLVKQNGLKMIGIVMPQYTDFDRPFANAGEEFRKNCGWPQGNGKLSEINLSKFSQNFGAMLDALKAANLTVDAFEIGSEFDTMCYDADVPVGHFANDQEIATWVKGYGEFLKAAALVIRAPNHFPQAKIVTFGAAHGDDKWDVPTRHLANPAAVVAKLRNVNGFNYFDNPQYHIDGYGTHIYPWPGAPGRAAANTLKQDLAAFGSDKPIWVTEFGFLSHNSFPTPSGLTREQATQELLTTFGDLSASIHFGPLMFYSYNGWLTDDPYGAGKLEPQANVLSAYYAAKAN
jgi:hypothetical protein